MSDYKLGAHILESLTIGMYQDSRIIFREYIQNACDSIDAAVRSGVLSEGEGEIRIEIDLEARNILIEDNGTGIKAADFVEVMGSVAASDKDQRENKGFRGIGKLCGMAYCAEVVFTSKFRGEGVISRLTCNAKILREFFGDKDSGLKQESAQSVLATINEFSSERTDDTDGHYFRVELIGINDENKDLLNYERVKSYLSFAAPLPYYTTFSVCSPQIYGHARELGLRIDEYDIFLNGEQLFKPYTHKYATSLGEDEVFDVEFKDIRDKDSGILIAWLWFGVSTLRAQIDKDCPMWGIRLRKGNIQIGDQYTMMRFFPEDRGNRYFIGELFCVSDELIPNARRDYFNESPQCAKFESAVEECARELAGLYKGGSDLNSSYRKAKQAEERITALQYRLMKGYFADDKSREHAEEELAQVRDDVEKHNDKFKRTASKNELLGRIAERIEHRKDSVTQRGVSAGDSAVRLTQAEQKLLKRVFGIITEELGNTAASLIQKIEEGLKLK